jgi:hypothetical protein
LANFKSKATLILASKSPRRAEILQLMGFGLSEFAVFPSDFPEDLDKKGISFGRVDGGRAREGRMDIERGGGSD